MFAVILMQKEDKKNTVSKQKGSHIVSADNIYTASYREIFSFS